MAAQLRAASFYALAANPSAINCALQLQWPRPFAGVFVISGLPVI